MTTNTQQRITYRTREVAAMLGMSKSAIHNIIARGELKTLRSGRAVRVLAADVDRWVSEHSTGAGA